MSPVQSVVSGGEARREVELADGLIRIRTVRPQGHPEAPWSQGRLPLPPDASGPVQLHAAYGTEWNTELFVELPTGAELWRTGPAGVRRRYPLEFAPGVPLWGVSDVEAETETSPNGFSFRARNERRYDIAVDSALGGPRGGPLTRALPGRPRYLLPSTPAQRQDMDFDVFVSYKSTETSELAAQAAGWLEERQAAVWFDRDDLRVSTFEDQIFDGIQRSYAFLVFFSPSSDSPTGSESFTRKRGDQVSTFQKMNQLREREAISKVLDPRNNPGGRFAALYSVVPGEPRGRPYQVEWPETRSLEDFVDDIVRTINANRTTTQGLLV